MNDFVRIKDWSGYTPEQKERYTYYPWMEYTIGHVGKTYGEIEDAVTEVDNYDPVVKVICVKFNFTGTCEHSRYRYEWWFRPEDLEYISEEEYNIGLAIIRIEFSGDQERNLR